MRGGYDLLIHLLALSPLAVQPAAAARRDRKQDLLLPPIGPIVNSPPPSQEHVFTLRHILHKGSHQYPNLFRKVDITQHTKLQPIEDDLEDDEDDIVHFTAADEFRVNSEAMTVQRLKDRRRKTIDRLLEAGELRGESVSLPSSAWAMEEISGPNITDKETILALARMAANAYVTKPDIPEWVDAGAGFNYTEDFGWEADGLRGHIFADTNNKTVVIGLKGTSLAVFDGIDTTGNDKTNDNLFGSCCCGQGGPWEWKKVCDCQTSTYTCNSTCLVKSLREKSHYYHAAQDLYHNVTELYPNADIWLTGHSLGGVVSSLVGLTFGVPVVTFEAFPDALGASRLGLPTPPGYHIGTVRRKDSAAFHFGHTADPVYTGTCNGVASACTLGGYAFQGKCHTGQTCTYDTVKDFGWRVGIGTHRITSVVRDVIEKYDTVPTCEQDLDCTDCYEWKFFESNGTETTTTRSPTSSPTSTRSRTRTETCLSPGWWGCLDEPITVPVTTTQTLTSTTCLSPGWFGCKEASTTTETTTITSGVTTPAAAPTVTTTSTVAPTTSPSLTSVISPTTATSSSSSTTSSSSVSSTATTTCATPGWFGCNDPTKTSSSATLTPTPSKTCMKRNYLGRCKEWVGDGHGDDKIDLR